MKKLDWYIIKKYLATFFFSTLMITMVAIAINMSENLSKFLDKSLGMKEILLDYYVHFIPWINGILWPLFALISVIFFTSRLARNSEIVAMLSAGVSNRRLLVPYLIAASFLATLLWIGNNYVIPRSNKLKNDFESEMLRKKRIVTRANNVHFFVDPNTKIYVRYYRKRDSTAQDFRIETFDTTGQLVQLLEAKKLKFKEDPNIWTLENYKVRTFNGLKEAYHAFPKTEKDTVLSITPNDFVIHTKRMEIMTTTELKDYIKREESRGLDNTKKYYTEYYRRTADPITILILTIIGMAIASRKVRGGMGVHLALGIVISAIFVVLSKFSITFANNLDLPPVISIWAPNIIFLLIAIYLLQLSKK